MSKEESDIFYFLSFCIKQYKTEKGMDGADVASLFLKMEWQSILWITLRRYILKVGSG